MTRRQIALLYVLYFVAHGIGVPYLPVAMRRIGLDGSEIGLAMAAALALQFATPPFWGYLADSAGSGSRMLLLAGTLGVAGMAACASLPGKAGFITGFLIFVLGRSAVGPMLDALAVSHPDVGTRGYGAVRRWGSVGFILSAFLTGQLLDTIGARTIPAAIAVCWLLLLAALAHTPQPARLPGAGLPPLSELYGQRQVWAFLGVSAIHAACGIPFESYFANYASDTGLSGSWIGAAWAAGVGLEVLVLTGLGTLIERAGPKRILLVAYGAGVVRWGLTALSPGGVSLAAVQVLHGLTFGASLGASVVWMNRAVPPGLQNSAQSIFAAVAWGLGGIAGQIACGLAYERFGGRALFAGATLLELVPFACMFLMREPQARPR